MPIQAAYGRLLSCAGMIRNWRRMVQHLKLESVARIIALADATGGYVAELELASPTAAERRLRRAIAALNDGERAEFMALLWLGRGDAGPEHWNGMVAHACKH